jgi:hypothetical protein
MGMFSRELRPLIDCNVHGDPGFDPRTATGVARPDRKFLAKTDFSPVMTVLYNNPKGASGGPAAEPRADWKPHWFVVLLPVVGSARLGPRELLSLACALFFGTAWLAGTCALSEATGLRVLAGTIALDSLAVLAKSTTFPSALFALWRGIPSALRFGALLLASSPVLLSSRSDT